jgi:8-oxo-dGTP diphosphatase
MKRMVVGFAFDATCAEVLLLAKKKPAWQEGRVNGIGGHIEGTETPLAAMQREAIEEVGERMRDVVWEQFALMDGPGWEVFCFRAVLSDEDWNTASWWNETDDGEFFVSDVDNLPVDVLNNLRWLVPLAKDTTRDGEAPYSPPLGAHVSYGP